MRLLLQCQVATLFFLGSYYSVISLPPSHTSSSAPPLPAIQQDHRSECVLYFAGDVMGHLPFTRSGYDEVADSFSYDQTFAPMRDIIQRADLAFANLEVTLAGPPFTGYARFSAPDALARSLRDAGFDILLTANNHSNDRGPAGLVRTLDVLDSLGLRHTGTFRDGAERDPFIAEANGIRIAILNYTYGTNGIPVTTPTVVNLLDSAQIHCDVERLRTQKPDLLIIYLHWGEEYQRAPGRDQRAWANFFFSLGADAVIGAHPHVVQPIELIRDQGLNVLAFSLGNFVSNQRERYRDGGIGLFLYIEKDTLGARVRDITYSPAWVWKTTSKKPSYFVLPAAALDTLTALPASARQAFGRFLDDTRSMLSHCREQ